MPDVLSNGREPEPFCVIDATEFEAAKRDPKVQELHRQAEAYAQKLIASGHCPCHLVVNCPGGV